MAITSNWKYSSAGDFSLTKGSTERFWFSESSTAIEAVAVDKFAEELLVVNSGLTSVIGSCYPVKYASETQVYLGGSATAVDLNTSNVLQSSCSVKVEWEDDSASTALTDCRFYIYDGVNVDNAPDGILVVAFEHDGTVINKNAVGETTGKAWNGAVGIGGRNNALKCSDQASASLHSFYLGLSAKPTDYGTHSGVVFAMEFDVS